VRIVDTELEQKMAVEQWSDSIILGELIDDPQFTDDITQVIEQCTNSPRHDVLLNFAEVQHLNSSNLAKLLKLRKLVAITNQRRLKLCNINAHVWGVFLVTGLDRIFDVAEDLPTGLAGLQME
jgi:anti-anti-sigma factor